MATPVYRFGRFRLDPRARELLEDGARVDLPLATIDCLVYLIRHRDRPIGRDELASAVWGRVDVSEASLNHAVMRLRRHLGDTGNEQRVIRTVPRHGYRWVLEIEEELPVEASAPRPKEAIGEADDVAVAGDDTPLAAAAPEAAAHAPATPRATPRRRFVLALVLLTMIALGFAVIPFVKLGTDSDVAAAPVATAVLPVEVDAGAEWAWLRFGLMDLVASQLQRTGLAVVASEVVVAVTASPDGDVATRLAPIAAGTVRASASFANGQWRVHLERRVGEASLVVDTRDADPVRATRAAADELVIKLGRAPPQDAVDDETLARETLRRRISAAVLAGQVDVARHLLEAAPPALRTHPDIALSEASLAFFAGEYDASRALAERLLASLPADAPPALRARAWTTLGAAQFRLWRLDDAQRSYTNALALAAEGADAGAQARAHIGLGGIASQRMRLEDAADHYGRARTLHAMRDDAFGVAAVDLNLGMNALQRGQPAQALVVLRGADTRFATLHADDALTATLAARADAEVQLLDIDAARATASRMLDLERRVQNPRQRGDLMLARAQIAVAAGRLDEADGLLSQILDASDPDHDGALRASAEGVLAASALLRGRAEAAAESAMAAHVPDLLSRHRGDYARAWLVRCRALQRLGRSAEAADEVARLRAWSDADPTGAETWIAMLAEASQAEHEGRRDDALAQLAEALQAVLAREVPEEVVTVAEPYVRLLLTAGRVDDAVSVNGRIAAHADHDARAARSAARIYAALGDAEAAAQALARATSLAGERTAMLDDAGP